MEDIYNDVITYCEEYNIPLDYLFEILRDQKVIPMIRGKATEYNAYIYIKEHLNNHIWDVQKLNLNAQNNEYDEDVSITHRASGIRLKVECKNASRASFKTGVKTKKCNVPHFTVKCHRSRSNMTKSDTTNDRYIVGEFDLLVANPSNALYQSRTDDVLELLDNEDLMAILYQHYNVSTEQELIKACNNDWRFVIPEDIAEGDYNALPRMPVVYLQNDPNWTTIEALEDRLLEIVNEKRRLRRQRR